MTDNPLSRRHFFGATATVAVGTQFHADITATEVKPSPLIPEPPLPPGVCQRLGSARFRELTNDFRFSPDSKWLAQFDGRQFIGCEVATGRRTKWQTHADLTDDQLLWQMTTASEVLVAQSNIPERPIYHFDLTTGRERKGKVVAFTRGQTFTSDGTGLIQYEDTGRLCRLDLRTRKRVWVRKWKTEASVPAVTFEVTERWVVVVGVKRLHLFDIRTGADGPQLEDALPPDAPPDNHFIPLNFSADGKRVCGWFTAAVPGRAVVWDLETGKVVGRLSPPADAESAALSADGRHLLTTLPAEQDRLAAIDVRTGRVTRKLAARNVGLFVLSPDGKVLAALNSTRLRVLSDIVVLNNESGGIVRLLDPATGEQLPQSPDPPAELDTVRFGGTQTILTDLTLDRMSSRALVWDLRTGRWREAKPLLFLTPNRQLVGPTGFSVPPSAQFSPDGTRWVAEVQSRVVVTDAFTGRTLHAFAESNNWIERPFWMGRGKIARFMDGGLVVWDLGDHTRRSIPLKFVAEGMGQTTAITPDGRTVAFHYWDDNNASPVTWLNVASGELTTQTGESGRLAVSADGHRVAITAGGEIAPGLEGVIQVTVIDRSGRQVMFRQKSGTDVTEPRAELSPCGRMAFMAHLKRTTDSGEVYPVMQFWEVVSGELRAEFATTHMASGLGVSPCGRRIATTHRDAPIYLWDVFGEKSDPQPKPDKAVWGALNGPTDKAFTAIRRLVQHPAVAVELLSAKLNPAQGPKPEWVKARINNLGNPDFHTRHKAELELTAVADVIVEPLKAAFDAGADTQEAHERLERLVQRATGLPEWAIRTVRAVEVLEYCEGKAASQLLKKLASGVESAVLTREAKAAVKRRGERPT